MCNEGVWLLGRIGCATVATLTFTNRIEEEIYNNPKELQSLPRMDSAARRRANVEMDE